MKIDCSEPINDWLLDQCTRLKAERNAAQAKVRFLEAKVERLRAENIRLGGVKSIKEVDHA
jgi:hypothetical protein